MQIKNTVKNLIFKLISIKLNKRFKERLRADIKNESISSTTGKKFELPDTSILF